MNGSRRQFLSMVSAIGSTCLASRLVAGDRPEVTNPRSTSGDRVHEPRWKEMLTITVGPADANQADLVGKNEKVIQAAVDYAAQRGGGTVRILPGTYRFRNAVHLPSGIRIQGSGADSILIKEASVRTKLTEDSDWYDQEITLDDDTGFQVGDGITLRTKNPHNNGTDVMKRTLVARDGKRFKLDRALRQNLWLSGEPSCATLFPLFSGEEIENVTIENLTLDGNRGNNEHLDGNYAGCIFLQDCNRITMRDLTTRRYHGDGISWQICHDVTVERCHSHDNADLGLHPGSGSQRPVIRDNVIERNTIGLFWCWGVKYGLAENNRIDESANYGISIGHNDTDNVMRNNVVSRSGKVGVLFRDEARGKDFWPNRNVLENNRILDSGGDEGIAIDLQGRTKGVRLVANEIRETRAPSQRTGIRVGAETTNLTLADNQIQGFATAVRDMRA